MGERIMKKLMIAKGACVMGLTASILVGTSTGAIAKQRPISIPKSKNSEMSFIKGISGEASLTVREKLVLSPDEQSFQFQNGKVADSIEYYKSPRCYLHMRSGNQQVREIAYGQVLKVSKIDNIYTKGSIHVTFWFDKDQKISDLTCISNNNHTLNAAELRATLGNVFDIALSKSLEKDALFNIAPTKNASVLSESAPAEVPNNSARFILSDS
jgi:hypothetical protein